jgi:hypothetical protein
MRPDQFGGHAVTEARRHPGRTHDVGEHDRPVSRVHVRRLAGRRLRILDAAQKGFHRGKRDFDNLSRDMAVRFAMYALGGVLVRRINEAERRAALLVEPVGEEFYSILILDFEILAMRVRDIGGRYSFHIVAVHEDRHRKRSYPSFGRYPAIIAHRRYMRIANLSDGSAPRSVAFSRAWVGQ